MLVKIEELEKKQEQGNYQLIFKEWGGVISYHKNYTNPHLLLKYIKKLEQECFCSYKIIRSDKQ